MGQTRTKRADKDKEGCNDLVMTEGGTQTSTRRVVMTEGGTDKDKEGCNDLVMT